MSSEMTAAAVSQFPERQRRQFEPVIKDVSLKFLDPDAFYTPVANVLHEALRRRPHDDVSGTGTYSGLSHHASSGGSGGHSRGAGSRRRFEANLKSDPPNPNASTFCSVWTKPGMSRDLQVRIVAGIVNAMSAGLGAQMPADLETQSAAFTGKIRPILAGNVLQSYLYTYRNTEDADLEDYIGAAQQKDVQWFNRNLQEAILAVAKDRAAKAGEAIKAKVSLPAN